jgi:Contractile injection system tube protein
MTVVSISASSVRKFQVSIGSLDEPKLTVHAWYRPKELQVDQTVPWIRHTSKSPDGSLQLEFSGAEGQSASLELFFDASEQINGTIEKDIDTLLALSRVRDPHSREDKKKRPHHCVLVFGNIYKNQIFRCVIESMSTKFTMFSPNGDAIRATVNLKLRETNLVDMSGEQKIDRDREKQREEEMKWK